MKQKNGILLLIALFLTGLQLQAQTSPEQSAPGDQEAGNQIKKNFIKTNLSSIVVKNYSLQYERALSKHISLAAAYRTMPTTSIPFKKIIEDAAAGNGDQETINAIEKLKISNFAITPELRFYVGKKGYGRGFYIAPFYRYASFTANNITFDYGDDPNQKKQIALSGKLTSNTGGLLFGAQWALGKIIVLDWWIFGPHYGSATGTFSGVSSQPLSASEQQQLRQNIDDIDIPLTTKTVVVNSNGATLKLDGPWGGVRGGISLGVRF